jgi:hypothetical protein
MPGAIQHLELLFNFVESEVIEFSAHGVIVEGGNVDGGLIFAARYPFKQMYLFRAAVINSFERRTIAEGPDDG